MKKNWRVVVNVPVADVQDARKDDATLVYCREWAEYLAADTAHDTDIKILCEDEAGNIVSYPLEADEEVPGPATTR